MGTNERREREKQRRRDDIVSVARRLFFEKGFREATIDDIARLTELARGTIYLYFENKEAIYATVMEEGLDLLNKHIMTSYDPKADALTNLLAGHDAFIKFHDNYPEYYNVMTMDKMQILSVLPLSLKERLDQKFVSMVRWIARVLQEGVEQKIFRAISVHDVAVMQMGIAMGYAQMLDKCGPHSAWPIEQSSSRQVLHDLIANGILARPRLIADSNED